MTRTKQMTLGAGRLFFDPFDEDGLRTGEFYLGNTQSVVFAGEDERRGRWTSDETGSHKTDSVSIGYDGSIRFVVDDLQPEVLGFMLRAEPETTAQTGSGLIYQEFNGVKRTGLWYQLGVDAANPTGLRSVIISGFYVNGGARLDAATAAANFEYDNDLARVHLREDAPTITLPGKFTIEYRRVASSRLTIKDGGEPIRGALRYIADNKVGNNASHYWPCVELSFGDSVDLKAESWSALTFTGEVLKDPELPLHIVDLPPEPNHVLRFSMPRDPMPAIDDSWDYLHGNILVGFALAGKGRFQFEASTIERENIVDTGYDEWVDKPWFRYRFDPATNRLRVDVWGELLEDLRFYILGDREENGWEPGDPLIPAVTLDGKPLEVAYTVTAEPDTGAAVAYPENAPFPVVDFDIHFEVPRGV